MLPVPLDGLTRRFVALPNMPRYEGRELRDLGVLEIPAFPADAPDVGPSAVAEVASVVGRLDMSEEVRRDLLSVLGVEGRRRFFIRAVALVFEAVEHSEVLLDFVIDDRPSPDHASAFTAAEGVRKLGLLATLRDSGAEQAVALVSQLFPELPDDREVAALRRASDAFQSEVEQLEEHIASVGDEGERERLSSKLEETAAKLKAAEDSLSAMPVRSLEVY
jgi:hypothetical protein